ncbi:DMT family transporter [Actinomycetospora endophytica]|uniref:DMT family transporter n=1 Tax=Actinomycetospora endophytica TaxID=2291215 RepID=A0ABS8P1A8_9PSEU|nr:DMT family transporter [Actinomycetospora endophytica]MCD2192021.1 DMT family transporter [Actinomycetospora endophytica]
MITLVLGAAAVGALGLVLLRKATEAEPPQQGFSWSLLWLLIRRRPVWAAGLAAVVGSFALQIAAIANGPVSLVQLVVVMELPFTLLLSAVLLGGRLERREWFALAVMTAGVAGLLLALAPSGGDPTSVPLSTWVVGLALGAGAIGSALVWARRTTRRVVATALAGVAAGVSAGLGAVLVKPVTAALAGGVGSALAAWQTWMLLVVGGVGFFLLQNALQAGRLIASQPGITLANPLVATLWGVGVYGEHVRSGWWSAAAGVGGALLVAGVIVLSGSPLLEGHREAPEQAPAAGR